MRAFAFAVAISLAAATAHAQPCLSVTDGQGGIHLTCPDGRTGFLTDTGTGVSAGIIGGQAYATPSTNLAPPAGLRSGVPGATFIAPPLTAPQLAPPPPLPVPAQAAPSLNRPAGLTALQQTYLQEQSAKALVH